MVIFAELERIWKDTVKANIKDISLEGLSKTAKDHSLNGRRCCQYSIRVLQNAIQKRQRVSRLARRFG